MDILKEIFKGVGEKIRTPQFLGLIGIILLIYRTIFRLEFKNLLLTFISSIGKFAFLIKIFELVAVMVFIYSVITFIACTFITIIYIVISEVKNKKILEKLSDISITMHSFFIGSKIAVVSSNMWLIVACSYFYIFDEEIFNKYKSYIVNYVMDANYLVKIIGGIYIFSIFISLLNLLRGMSYKFLYFSVDEKTKIKLHG